MAQCERSLALRPEAHYNLGATYDGLGLTALTIREYRRTLGIDSEHAPASNNLGEALADLGELDEVQAMFQRALRIHPDFAEARFNLVKSQAQRVRTH